jgi:hypothetical protein
MKNKVNITIGLNASTIDKLDNFLKYTLIPKQQFIENAILKEMENSKIIPKHQIIFTDGNLKSYNIQAYDFKYYGPGKSLLKILDKNLHIISYDLNFLVSLEIDGEILISENSPFINFTIGKGNK